MIAGLGKKHISHVMIFSDIESVYPMHTDGAFDATLAVLEIIKGLDMPLYEQNPSRGRILTGGVEFVRTYEKQKSDPGARLSQGCHATNKREDVMPEHMIYITVFDKLRLEELIAVAEESGGHDRNDLEALEEELDKAEVVLPRHISSDVVTMNSKVVLRDLNTSKTMTYVIVFPKDANIDAGYISVLAPLGTAILGYARGDVVEWPVPSGKCRIRIEEVLYQPEAAGDFHL